jgi:hypothetical protein
MMRPWRPSEDTKVIEILLGPDFHEPGKARTVDDIFVRDEMSQWDTRMVGSAQAGARDASRWLAVNFFTLWLGMILEHVFDS